MSSVWSTFRLNIVYYQVVNKGLNAFKKKQKTKNNSLFYLFLKMNRMIFNLASTGLLTQHVNYCATKCLLYNQMDQKPVNAVCQRRSVDLMGKFRSYAQCFCCQSMD